MNKKILFFIIAVLLLIAIIAACQRDTSGEAWRFSGKKKATKTAKAASGPERLSTGLRIDGGKDDPAGLATDDNDTTRKTRDVIS